MFIATQSMPTVSYDSSSAASFTLVPTPSVHAANTGSDSALEELLVEIQAEQASESTHGTHDPRTMSSFECRLHHGHGSITSIDIDT